MKDLLPLLIAAGVIALICIVIELVRRSNENKKAAVRRVRVSKYYSFFGITLSFMGAVMLLFYLPEHGVPAGLGGGLLLLAGLALLAVYCFTFITYDESACRSHALFHGTAEYSFDNITGQLLLPSRLGERIALCFGSETLTLYPSMDEADAFLKTAYEGYLRAKHLTPEEFPAPDPADLLWFPAPDETY